MSEVRPGKRKKRSELKSLLLLMALKRKGPLGRYRLKEMLAMSEREGVVRLMLTDLRDDGLIRTSKAGCELSEEGEKYLAALMKRYGIIDLKAMNLEPLRIGPQSFVLHLRGHKIPKAAVELRDVAVKAGASGAVLLSYENGVLRIPSVYPDLADRHPNIAEEFLRNFNLIENDFLIASFSVDEWRALEGALAATMFSAKSKTSRPNPQSQPPNQPSKG